MMHAEGKAELFTKQMWLIKAVEHCLSYVCGSNAAQISFKYLHTALKHFDTHIPSAFPVVKLTFLRFSKMNLVHKTQNIFNN